MPSPRRHVDDTFDLIEQIYGAAYDCVVSDDLLDSLKTYFRAAATILFTQAPGTTQFNALAHSGFEDRFFQSYPEIAACNPWFRVPGYMRPGRILTERSLDAAYGRQNAYQESAFYAEWARPQGFEHSIGSALMAEGEHLVSFTFMRLLDEGPFSAADEGDYALMSRHLAKAIRISQRIARFGVAARTARSVIERLPLAVMYLDRSGRMCDCNGRAEALLAARDVFTVRQGVLHATRASEDARLQRLSRSAVGCRGKVSSAFFEVLSISRDDAATLSLTAIPVDAGMASCGDAIVAALLISSPDQRHPPSADYLAARFQLSAPEVRLVTSLIEKDGLKQAAAAAGMSYETARWHLKAIFQKTQTHRQSDLMRLLTNDLAAAIASAG
ncbi:helix-turn-helix transcriptional regulator [Pararhizobium haloflavum]|uniref:helix-turn-helix transcriptional regulator n=1 Tax=Pararhizobium haloflavum TaxID=2037914 RepID=UPI000C1A33EB|nr:hypothetical protein [Pararhizobium haloflavum]